MKAQELANIAESFTYTGIKTCYLKGFWGQRLTQQEYDRVLRMYPENSKYKNEKYIGTDVFPFDCICFVKGILGGCTPNRRISYQQMAANPIGDCTTETFAEKLYDLVPGRLWHQQEGTCSTFARWRPVGGCQLRLFRTERCEAAHRRNPRQLCLRKDPRHRLFR